MGRDTKLVIFNLPEDIREVEVEDIFAKFGKIRSCAVKAQGRTAMSFLEFEDHRDAADAKERRHGWTYEGEPLRVEYSKKDGRADSRKRTDSRRRRQSPKSVRDSWYKLKISGLPTSSSWQDLKDFLRKGGKGQVKFTEVTSPGVGVAGFATQEEVDQCVDDLDGSKFTARNGDTEKVTLKSDGGGSQDRRSRSRSRR